MFLCEHDSALCKLHMHNYCINNIIIVLLLYHYQIIIQIILHAVECKKINHSILSPVNCFKAKQPLFHFSAFVMVFSFFQSRPITTSNQETEEELIHEFDSPLNIKHHWLTTANVG